ncbi:MAG: hypothetical protein IPP85_12010 [Propionivibrio sp.]|nr:hypothetical protein [Propionivibrio sp.]
MRHKMLKTLAGLAIALTMNPGHGADLAEDLPELNIDIKQTTVSGISSGAFMAVQVGVAKSSSVKGVAITAGGPYFCALQSSFGGAGSTIAIGRCMQGDPMFPTRPITSDDLKQMEGAARDWSEKGKIDPVSNLANQAVWVFHGYNDGVVKLPVSQALVDWYGRFTPKSQIFHKDSLNAAHAQISAACGDSGTSSCNLCPATGGKFINSCGDQPPVSGQLYDAAGAALQLFYGPLARTESGKLNARPQAFSQAPYLKQRDGTTPVDKPDDIAMGKTGYVYVPESCRQVGQPCRLHIAFHGCMQSATTLGTDFVDNAGVNEWADANNIVVLYPQAMPTMGMRLPLNPNGCWDWWGYNDTQDMSTLGARAGTFATRDGVQIAAVWRMVEKLTSKGSAAASASISGPTTRLMVVDQSDRQAVLRWQAVEGASGYRVYRASAGKTPVALGKARNQPFLVDAGLSPSTLYTYTVRPVIGGSEVAGSNEVSVTTARKPPACNPYFSMLLGKPVKPYPGVPTGMPTTDVCQ